MEMVFSKIRQNAQGGFFVQKYIVQNSKIDIILK